METNDWIVDRNGSVREKVWLVVKLVVEVIMSGKFKGIRQAGEMFMQQIERSKMNKLNKVSKF